MHTIKLSITMTDLETILSWFQTGDMPTQEEFRETFSSFRHNSTKIPIAEVEGLQSSLNNKVNIGDIIGGGGDVIPLSGTEPNKPLNGDIQINQANYETRFYAEQNGYSSELYFQGIQRASLRSKSPAGAFTNGNNTIIDCNLSGANIQWNNGDYTSESKITTDNNGVYIKTKNPEAERYLQIDYRGISTNAIIQGDSTFTRKLVQKNTGEIGYLEEGIKETGQISSDDFIMLGGSSANGIINYEHQEGSEYVTIRFRLNATLKDENIYIPLPFGIGISNLRRFANLGFNDQFINISSQEQVIILSKLNFAGDLSVYINECIVFPYGYEGAQN